MAIIVELIHGCEIIGPNIYFEINDLTLLKEHSRLMLEGIYSPRGPKIYRVLIVYILIVLIFSRTE